MFTLEIETENDAFTGDPTLEIARILTDVASKLRSWHSEEYEEHWLRDVNGNKVGRWQLV